MKFGLMSIIIFPPLFVMYHIMSNRFFCFMILFDTKSLLEVYLLILIPLYKLLTENWCGKNNKTFLSVISNNSS